MSSVRSVLRAWLVALISRRRGKVRALRDVQHLGEVLRFVLVFAVLMLLPTGFLAWQALNGIASDPAGLDRQLQQRATAMAEASRNELDAAFLRFEAATLGRLERGESVTTNLEGLDKEALEAAFRFDRKGTLIAPFERPASRTTPEPPAAWREAARVARRLEATDSMRAWRAWRQLGQASSRADLRAECLLGEIRALRDAERYTAARERAVRLYEFGEVRGRHGIRMDHLGRLTVSELRLAQGLDPDADRGSLEDLASDLLNEAPWAVGRRAEPALVREILTLLQPYSTPGWLAETRAALNAKDAQLSWAESVMDELDLFPSRLSTEREFRYIAAQPDSRAVWATVRNGSDIYAFSFSARRLRRMLSLSLQRRNAADPDLTARLVATGYRSGRPTLAERELGELPLTVMVEPTDPEALAAARSRRRNIRVAVILMAVLISMVGVFWVARMLALEVEAARQRAEFAANVSHELRSPITQIRLKGEALQLGLVDPGSDMQDHFDAIVRESERLTRLVDNVLDFASIERGAKRYRLRQDDLLACVRKAIEDSRPLFAEQNLPLHVELPDQLPPLFIDREAIEQVLDNLLSNAAKYGAPGPSARLTVLPTDDFVEIVVSDRGLGIHAKDLPFVFDDFFRSQDPDVRRRKGTGIGLAIARYIVEAHGGTIDVQSTPGEGATFIVRLPWQPPRGLEI